MKCINCGYELTNDAVFCENCGTPVGGEKMTIIDGRYGSTPHIGQPSPRRYADIPQNGPRRYRDEYEAPRRSRAENEYRGAPRRYAPENDRRNAPSRSRSSEPPKKKHTALIISIIALILVIAITAGVIFFVNADYVSAAELQSAKDSYLPPSQAVQIDTSLKDPSNDNIKFKYDDRDRIIACSYTVNDKKYDQEYTYNDTARAVEIETKYKNRVIYRKEISYDDVPAADTFEEVDGYYIRLDEESVDGASATEAPAPTEAPQITDASEVMSDVELESFLKLFTLQSGDKFYDCRQATEIETNILQKICCQFSCINWELYPGYNPIDSGNQLETHDVMCDADKTEWICKNIFNITDNEIDTLYQKANNDPNYTQLWKETIDDRSYYCYTFAAGKGGPDIPILITDIQTDGRFYYITYGQTGFDDRIIGDPFYTVMEKKLVDGKKYWSMYYHSASAPETIEPFDPKG